MADSKPAVIFDLDGTLIDSAPDLCHAVNAVMAEAGLPAIPLADVRHMVGQGALVLLRKGFAAHGREPDDQRLQAWRQVFLRHYEAHCLKETRPFPGAVDCLSALGRTGYPLGICTNKPFGLTRMVLDGLGLGGHFKSVVGGDSLTVGKPDPRPLRKAIRDAGAEAAVMVGDSINDVGAARGAGVPVVAVSFGYTDIPARALGADAVIDHFSELPGLIESLAGADRAAEEKEPVKP